MIIDGNERKRFAHERISKAESLFKWIREKTLFAYLDEEWKNDFQYHLRIIEWKVELIQGLGKR